MGKKGDYVPDLNASSSKTLKAANLLGSTPCRDNIWMEALLKPQAGVSGVPFMKRTTGADPTACSIEALVSAERHLLIDGVRSCGKVRGMGVKLGRAVARSACSIVSLSVSFRHGIDEEEKRRTPVKVRANDMICVYGVYFRNATEKHNNYRAVTGGGIARFSLVDWSWLSWAESDEREGRESARLPRNWGWQQ